MDVDGPERRFEGPDGRLDGPDSEIDERGLEIPEFGAEKDVEVDKRGLEFMRPFVVIDADEPEREIDGRELSLEEMEIGTYNLYGPGMDEFEDEPEAEESR